MRIVQPINSNWQFKKKGEEWQQVNLPHTYNAVDGQDGSPMYRGEAVYTRTLNVAKEENKDYYLEVGASALMSEVIVNGNSLYKGNCGFAMYRVKLNDVLKDGDNEIVVNVANTATAKLYPAMADFSFYGGIYRPVSLITEDPLHFAETDLSRDGLILEPEVTGDTTGVLHVKANVEGAEEGKACVRICVLSAAGEVVAEGTSKVEAGKACVDLAMENVHRWDGLDDPYLYTVCAAVLDEKGQVSDERKLMTGFRTIAFTPEDGFMLNGKKIKLNGVARHQDFWGVGNAVTPETMALDMSIIREVGTNSLRCSHYQHPDEWYDLCDRNGLLVWAEIPCISVVAQYPEADQNAMDQLERLIAQARNHCSIYCWGVQNETCMGSKNEYTFELCRKLAERAKELDSTRMTAQANEYTTDDDCPILYHTDISGHNLYYGWYYGTIPELEVRLDSIHAHNPQAPIMLTEYGVDTNVRFHSSTPKDHDYTEEYQLKFHENAIRVIDERSWMAGGYVWNMFDFGSAGRDEGGDKGKNQKGLVTIDRKIKKDAFYLYKAHWSKEPFVYVAGRRFKNHHELNTNITVISNMEELTLTVNGQIVDTKKAAGDMTVFENVALMMGENTIVAEAKNADGTNRIDRIVLCGVAEADKSYVLEAKKPVVVDWFAGLEGEEFGIQDAPLRPEGFTFDDIIQDIYDNDTARGIFLKFLKPLTENSRFENMKPFQTVRKLVDMSMRRGGMDIPEKLLKHCEQELNKIDK